MAFDAQVTEKSADMIVLERARERIARGWCQTLEDEHGNVCLVGALKAETGGVYSAWPPEQIGTVVRLLRAMGFYVSGDLDTDAAVAWNDHDGRTQAEVLARFDAAIAKLAAAQ